MIRTSKHILKYQTNHKTNILDQIFVDYKSCLEFYIDLIISEQLPLKKFLSSKFLPVFSNINHSQWRKVCYKQASEIVRSNIKFQSDKRYKRYKKVYTYFKKRDRQLTFISKKFKELNLKSIQRNIKISIENISINLDVNMFDMEQNKSKKYFDEFIKLRTPYFYIKGTRECSIPINIPIKHHKHSNKYKKWDRKNTIQLKKLNGNFYLNLFYEKDQPEIKPKGKSLGLDCGYKKLIATSDNQILGKEMEQIYESISRKQQGSENFNQSLTERDKLINQFCNELDLSSINHLVVEDLKNVKHKSKLSKKFNNKLQRWSYVKTLAKLEHLCEENGIQFTRVNPAYTSQTCSSCGTIDKTNRNGESYQCKVCGLFIDADINAANNILHRGVSDCANTFPLPKET